MTPAAPDLEKKVNFLTSITEGMLSSLELDEIIYVIMSGITSGEGMGFNRAFMFLLDEHRRALTCKMAVGPVSEEHAHRIWEAMAAKKIDLKSLIRSFRRIRTDPGAWGLTKTMSHFSIPGRNLAASRRRLPRRLPRSMSLQKLVAWSVAGKVSYADSRCSVAWRPVEGGDAVLFRRFVIAPLVRGKETMGALLADNVYSEREVCQDDIESLRGVTNLATLAIERARLYERMKRLAETDGLTGLLNRRIYEEKLRSLMEESVREGRPLSLLLFDLDHFKPINDRYGHLAGDDVIRETAGLMLRNLRAGDLSARYGGDEFAVVLARTDFPSAMKVAWKIAGAIQDLRFRKYRGLRLTVSGGVTCTSLGLRTLRRLVLSADRALYIAKALGRNRVEPARR